MKVKETDIRLNESSNSINECEGPEALTIEKVPKFIQKDVGKLIPIEDQITRVEIKHLKHYIEHEEEYQLKLNEKKRPYVIFLNERISKIIKTKNKQENERFVFYIFIGSIITIGSLFGIGTMVR